MRREDVIAARALNRGEVVLGGHLAYRDQLDAILLAVGRIHEQVAEVARALRFLERFTHRINVGLALCGIGHVEYEARVASVVVVAPTEQRGRAI